MGQKFRAIVRSEFSNGAIGWAPGGYADCIGPYAKVQNCPIQDSSGLRLTCYATGYADSWFSIPACTRYRGKYVRGYLSGDDNGGCVFRVLTCDESKIPQVKRNRTIAAANKAGDAAAHAIRAYWSDRRTASGQLWRTTVGGRSVMGAWIAELKAARKIISDLVDAA